MKKCPLCKGKLSKQECICFQVAVKAKAQIASIERIEEVDEEEFPIPERVGNLRAISYSLSQRNGCGLSVQGRSVPMRD